MSQAANATGAVVGRERELTTGIAFLDGLQGGSRALLIEGQAGIGKTTVWLQLVRAAEARGLCVLQARPAESEARLSYAALADLVAPVFEQTRGVLPEPQERALAATLLRITTAGPADPRTTATAVVSVLGVLARAQPVAIAIDDVQWADGESQRALEFAARRLPARVGLLLSRRSDGGPELPLGLDRALSPEALDRLTLGPLTLASLHHLVRNRADLTLSRPLLARVAAASGGNPFFALEMARALATDADGEERQPLPVPPSVRKLVDDRVTGLSPLAQEAVLVAASLSRPAADAIATALSPEDRVHEAIAECEEAGVLASEGGRVRFTHPLLASAVYAAASDQRRRLLHLRLAGVTTDAEERARHLALGTVGADEATAAEVAEAAQQAVLRGAFDAAAELFEAAHRLTPSVDAEARLRRRLGHASSVLRSGDVSGARLLAQSTSTGGLPPALEAQRLQLLAEIEWDDGAIPRAATYLEQALTAAADEPLLSAQISARLVLISAPGAPARARELAERAVLQPGVERDPALLSSLSIDLCLLDLLLGRTPRTELMERGLVLEAQAGPDAYPHPVPLIWFQSVDDIEAVRARHEREAAWARDHGDEPHGAERLSYLALAEFHAGNCELAERLIEQICTTIEERLEVSGRFAFPFAWRSFIDAHRGRLDRARRTLEPLVDETQRGAKAWWAAILLGTLGFVHFAANEHEAADKVFAQMRALLDELGITDGLVDRSEPFHVELLTRLGRLDDARETLERLERRGDAFPRLWIDVTLPRARAIVLAAEGEVAAGLAAVDALDAAKAERLPFELGRALLTKGRLLRRAKQRRAAADALRQAVETFERLDAPELTEQAHTELEIIEPGRRAPTALTASELRVAKLAASGLTNREIAKAAFMSAKTVEAHLARAYRKLGIRSRAELGARMGAHPQAKR